MQEDEDVRFEGVPDTQPVMDNMSQMSQANEGGPTKKMKITREVKGPNGEIQTITEIVHDPVVISQYIKKRRQQDLERIEYVHPHRKPRCIKTNRNPSIYSATLTDNHEQNKLILEM